MHDIFAAEFYDPSSHSSAVIIYAECVIPLSLRNQGCLLVSIELLNMLTYLVFCVVHYCRVCLRTVSCVASFALSMSPDCLNYAFGLL